MKNFLNDSFFSNFKRYLKKICLVLKWFFTNNFWFQGPEGLSKFFEGPLSPSNLSNAMNSLYKFENNIDSESVQGLQGVDKAFLNGLTAQFGTIAKKVYNNIVAASKNGIITETGLLNQYIKNILKYYFK